MILKSKTDDRDLRTVLNRLARSLEDFTPELRRTGKVVIKRIVRNFGELPAKVPLSPRTVLERRRLAVKAGRSFVKEDDTPLRRFDDSLFDAATAADADVNGSAYTLSPTELILGIDPERIVYARALIQGYPERNIPARDILETGVDEENAAAAILEAGLEKRIERADR